MENDSAYRIKRKRNEFMSSYQQEFHLGYEQGLEAGRVIANQMYLDGLSVISNIVEWHKERGLDKKGYNDETSLYLALEEEFECIGLDDKLGKGLASRYANYIINESGKEDASRVHPDDKVDAKFDGIVFKLQDIAQLGYDPIKVLIEGFKEINSRVGAYNLESGKWEKDTSDEAKSNWYKADYSKCRI